jgi:cell division protein FtsB
MDIQAQVDAMALEFANQRSLLGDRAVQLAAVNAQLRAEIETLKKRIAELEKPADSLP